MMNIASTSAPIATKASSSSSSSRKVAVNLVNGSATPPPAPTPTPERLPALEEKEDKEVAIEDEHEDDQHGKLAPLASLAVSDEEEEQEEEEDEQAEEIEGGGGASSSIKDEEEQEEEDEDDQSTSSSVLTEELLAMDTTYLALNEFLRSSKTGANITDVLEELCELLKTANHHDNGVKTFVPQTKRRHDDE